MGEYVNNNHVSDELWTHHAPARTPMWKFIQQVNNKYGLDIDGYPGLYKWSIDNVSTFWEDVWDFVGIVSSEKANQVRCISPFAIIFIDSTVLFPFCTPS